MKLSDYLSQADLTRPQFADLIGTSTETVRRYCEGSRIPTPEIMRLIAERTDNAVTANDFFGIAA